MDAPEDTSPAADTGRQLILMEKATVAAFQAKDEAAFVKHFSPRYIGVAGDGVKTAQDEVKGMLALDLTRIDVEDANATFPAPDTAIVTYRMVVAGRRGRTPLHATIHTATVYLRQGGVWQAALHTESVAQ